EPDAALGSAGGRVGDLGPGWSAVLQEVVQQGVVVVLTAAEVDACAVAEAEEGLQAVLGDGDVVGARGEAVVRMAGAVAGAGDAGADGAVAQGEDDVGAARGPLVGAARVALGVQPLGPRAVPLRGARASCADLVDEFARLLRAAQPEEGV